MASHIPTHAQSDSAKKDSAKRQPASSELQPEEQLDQPAAPETADAVQLTQLNPALLSPGAVRQLQRTIGNRAVQRLRQPQEQDDETAQSKPNPQPFQWLGMGEAGQRQTKLPVQRQREPRIQIDSGGESGNVQIREPSRAQELIVQRKGTYPDNFEDKTGQDIDEIAFGSGKQIKFTTMSSCIGIVARNGDAVTGVHLGMMCGDPQRSAESKWISEFKAADIINVIRGIIGSPQKVVYIGYLSQWKGDFSVFYNKLKEAIPPNEEVGTNADVVYTAGVQNNLLGIKRGGEAAYTEQQPAPPASKWSCFITTACMRAKGLPDDCEELMALRAFRDTYLIQQPNGRLLVEAYYQHAPAIVAGIAEDEDADAIYDHLYTVIRACVDAIHEGDNAFAYTTYCEMVLRLKEQYMPAMAVPSYR